MALFPDTEGPANIQLEPSVTLKTQDLDFAVQVTDDHKRRGYLHTTTFIFTIADLKIVPPEYREIIPESIKDYVSLNSFVA